MSKPVLELKNISKEYRQGRSIIEVLKSIDLSVMPAEMVAIIGASGSGKSSLLHIAGLLDDPSSGEVLVGDVLAGKSSGEALNYIRLKHIGFVYQYHHLLKNFSARENVAMPKLIAGGDYAKALEEADKLLAELGLAKRTYNMPGELSGGEQQRVAIARSLVNNPKIVLADEPTGNLDPSTAGEVFQLFLKLATQQGTAIVMVTHNYELAKRMHKCYELNYQLQMIAS